MKEPPRTLLVFLEGIDQRLVAPLIDRGILPTFKRLLSDGASADLVSLPPYNPAMLFASAVTGLRAARHGITGFPTTEDPVYIDGEMPQNALWNTFNSQGKQSLVVCDAPYLRASAIDGAFIDWTFLNPAIDKPVNGTHPPPLAEELASMHVTAKTLDPRVVRLVCPNLGAEAAARDPLALHLAESICGLYNTCNTAVSLMETEDWQFALVQISFIERIAALFGKIAVEPDAPLALRLRYEGVVENSCRLADLMLSRLVISAGDDANIFVISTRSRAMLDPVAFTAYPLVNPGFGFFAASGPSILKGIHIGTASLTDVAPTVLAAAGCQESGAFDGCVLREILENTETAENRACVRHCENKTELPAPHGAINRFNLAVDLAESGRHADAQPIYSEVLRENPESVTFAFWKACCEIDTGRLDDAYESAAAIRDNDSPEIPQIRLLLAILAGRAGQSDEVLALIGGKAAPGALPEILASMYARAMMSADKWEDAFDYLKAELAIRPNAGLWQSVAECYIHYGLYKDAELAARHIVAGNPRLAIGHVLLARALSKLIRNDEAWEEIREAWRLGSDLPFVKNAAETLYPERAAELKWPANAAESPALAHSQSPRIRKKNVDTPSFAIPEPDEYRRFAEIIRFRDSLAAGWNSRIWKAANPERIVGAASWKLVDDGRRAHLFVRTKPILNATQYAAEMLRSLIDEIRAAGASDIVLTEPEGRIPDEVVNLVCKNAEHWSDEDWLADVVSLREKLAAYDPIVSEAVCAGWITRPLAENDWKLLEKWSVGAGFLLAEQLAAIREHHAPQLSCAVQRGEIVAGAMVASLLGMKASMDFISGNPDYPDDTPVATAMLLRHLAGCETLPVDSVGLTTNLHKSRRMHILAKRMGMKLLREERHHLLTL